MNELEPLGDHFIGLWRFRLYGRPRLWSITFHINGYYYDTYPKRTVALAVRDALKIIERVKSGKKKILKSL